MKFVNAAEYNTEQAQAERELQMSMSEIPRITYFRLSHAKSKNFNNYIKFLGEKLLGFSKTFSERAKKFGQKMAEGG